MSGMQYRKIKYGPVADSYFRIIDEMFDSGEISIEPKSEGAMMISQTRSGAKVHLDKVKPKEISLIKKINDKWKDKKTSEIVDFTHKQMPYMFADENEIVSYDIFGQENPNDIF
jgi:glycine cleavage system protein P-like pyridoxal-binding family